MLKWDEYIGLYQKALNTETFYHEAKSHDDNEDSQKFFDQKIFDAIATQNKAQENAMCMNSNIRQVVTYLCLKHNTALAEKHSRKRKSTEKVAGGSSAQVQEPKKKAKNCSTKTIEDAPAQQDSLRQKTPTPPRQPTLPKQTTPPPPRQSSPPIVPPQPTA